MSNRGPTSDGQLSHDDRGPSVNAVGWTLTVFSGAILGLRIYCKFLKNRGLSADDYVLVFAWVCLWVSVIFLSVDIPNGFGRHLVYVSPEWWAQLALNGYVISTLTIVSVAAAKTSFAIMLARLFRDSWRWFVIVVITISNVTSFLAGLFIWVQCTPVAKNFNPMIPGTCWDPNVVVYYGIAAGIWSALMDFTLALLPWKLIWRLQMRKKEKIGVAVAMSLGFFSGITAVMKCVMLPEIAGDDFTYSVAPLVNWSIAEASAAMMAASIPVLRVLIRDVSASGRHGSGTKPPHVRSSGHHFAMLTPTTTASHRTPTGKSGGGFLSDATTLHSPGGSIDDGRVLSHGAGAGAGAYQIRTQTKEDYTVDVV